jgi:hypothetical protein
MTDKEIKDLKEDLEYYQLTFSMVRYKLSNYKEIILELNELLNDYLDQNEIFKNLSTDNAYNLKEILDDLDIDFYNY